MIFYCILQEPLTSVKDKVLLFLVATPNSYFSEQIAADKLQPFLSRFLFPQAKYIVNGQESQIYTTETLAKGKIALDKVVRKVFFYDAKGTRLFSLSAGLFLRFEEPPEAERLMTVEANATDYTSFMEVAKRFATRFEITAMLKDANNFYAKKPQDQIYPFVNKRFYFEGESTMFALAAKHRIEKLEDPAKRRICLYVPLKMKTKVHYYFHPMAQLLYRCIEADLKLLGPLFNPMLQPMLLDTPLYTFGYYADLLNNALHNTNRFTFTKRFASELDDLLYVDGKRMLAPVVILDDWHFASDNPHDPVNAQLSLMRRLSITMNWFTFLLSLDSSKVSEHDDNAIKEQLEAISLV